MSADLPDSLTAREALAVERLRERFGYWAGFDDGYKLGSQNLAELVLGGDRDDR
jgi:hypothetical protein